MSKKRVKKERERERIFEFEVQENSLKIRGQSVDKVGVASEDNQWPQAV